MCFFYSSSFFCWHKCFAHDSFSKLSFLINKVYLGTISVIKNHVIYIINSQNYLTLFFKSFHFVSIVWYNTFWCVGSTPILSIGSAKDYVIFVDDFSRFIWIYFLHYSFEFPSSPWLEHSFLSTQNFAFDSSGEYISNNLHKYHISQSTLFQLSCVKIPWQNIIS